MKIWAKIVKFDTKVDRDTIYETDAAFTQPNIEIALREISDRLDVSTPIMLRSYFAHFKKFNNVKFYPRDFVESVDFKYLELENCIEDKKEKKFYY